MYNFCIAIYPYVFILMPCLNFIARWGTVLSDDGIEGVTPATKAMLWVAIGTLLGTVRIASLAFSCVLLFTIINLICHSESTLLSLE